MSINRIISVVLRTVYVNCKVCHWQQAAELSLVTICWQHDVFVTELSIFVSIDDHLDLSTWTRDRT